MEKRNMNIDYCYMNFLSGDRLEGAYVVVSLLKTPWITTFKELTVTVGKKQTWRLLNHVFQGNP